jgi:hypothetical protein
MEAGFVRPLLLRMGAWRHPEGLCGDPVIDIDRWFRSETDRHAKSILRSRIPPAERMDAGEPVLYPVHVQPQRRAGKSITKSGRGA